MYSPASANVWTRGMDVEQGTAVERVMCSKELSGGFCFALLALEEMWCLKVVS